MWSIAARHALRWHIRALGGINVTVSTGTPIIEDPQLTSKVVPFMEKQALFVELGFVWDAACTTCDLLLITNIDLSRVLGKASFFWGRARVWIRRGINFHEVSAPMGLEHGQPWNLPPPFSLSKANLKILDIMEIYSCMGLEAATATPFSHNLGKNPGGPKETQLSWRSHDTDVASRNMMQSCAALSSRMAHWPKHLTMTSQLWNGKSLLHTKRWFGHRPGRSPCAHSIGKFFLCYISLFSSETSAPGLPGNYFCFKFKELHRIIASYWT